MEKIYMEESKKQKKSVMNLSVVLSFVVAIFAMFSLAMFGIVSNQGTGVSYAAETNPNEFHLKWGERLFAFNNSAREYQYYMRLYHMDSVDYRNIVFCIERTMATEDNEQYTRTTTGRSGVSSLFSEDPEQSDQGLLYLLGIGNDVESLRALTEYDDKIDAWTLQSAIWLYLSENYSDTVYQLEKDITDPNNNWDLMVLQSDTVYIGNTPGDISPYTGLTGSNGIIRKLVDEANTATAPKVTVEISDEKLAATEDGKYYQSGKVSVVGSPSKNFVSYTVTFDTDINGVIIVDADGNEMQTTDIAAGKDFYIRVPADKVSKETQTIKINAKGKFNGVTGYYYSAGDSYQRLANTAPGEINGGAELAVIGDTGMNAAQTIYFIGLIVLLCGVGIVYANAKPVASKQ